MIVVPWAVVAALWLRPPYYNAGPEPPQSVGREGIADERGFYVRLSRQAHPVTLAAIKADPAFAELGLVRMSRLSVVPVPANQWKQLLKMARS